MESSCGDASNSNLEIFERFQSKVLRIITDAPWYMPNTVIKCDLQVPTVKQEARKYSVNYWKRIDVHPNSLASALFQELGNRRLKRLHPGDLAINGYVSTWQHSPERASILAIGISWENITGSFSYMPLTLLTKRLLNVSGQIVTTRGLNKKICKSQRVSKEPLSAWIVKES
jgi:hypothetical protein